MHSQHTPYREQDEYVQLQFLLFVSTLHVFIDTLLSLFFTTEYTEITEKSYKKEYIEQYFLHNDYLCFLDEFFFLCVLCVLCGAINYS